MEIFDFVDITEGRSLSRDLNGNKNKARVEIGVK